jgi:hypothetical protein
MAKIGPSVYNLCTTLESRVWALFLTLGTSCICTIIPCAVSVRIVKCFRTSFWIINILQQSILNYTFLALIYVPTCRPKLIKAEDKSITTYICLNDLSVALNLWMKFYLYFWDKI